MKIPLNYPLLHKTNKLAGSKYAIKINRALFVSPAMHDLIAHAESQSKLDELMKHINIVDISRYDPWPPLTAQTDLPANSVAV